jgi:hypothetical protein
MEVGLGILVASVGCALGTLAGWGVLRTFLGLAFRRQGSVESAVPRPSVASR